jgi:hypothetical protein
MGERTLSFGGVEGDASWGRESANLLIRRVGDQDGRVGVADAWAWRCGQEWMLPGSDYLGDFLGRVSLLAPRESKSICFRASS